jgi:excisionase family DNA binding protein
MKQGDPHPSRVGRVDLSQPLLTAEQAAELLGVPRSSVYDYARRRNDPLPSVQIGRHRRFVLPDLGEWVDRQRPA